jgi:hypothetical protein
MDSGQSRVVKTMNYDFYEEEELEEEIQRIIKQKRQVQNKRNH